MHSHDQLGWEMHAWPGCTGYKPHFECHHIRPQAKYQILLQGDIDTAHLHPRWHPIPHQLVSHL